MITPTIRRALRLLPAIGLVALIAPEALPQTVSVDLGTGQGLTSGIVQMVAATSGSGAFMLDQPMQRYFRDVSMMATHFYHDQDTGFEPFGRVMVGLPPNTRLS